MAAAQQHPPVGTVSYPPIQTGLTVTDFLDTSRPLVKSKKDPTRCEGPKFVDESEQERRRIARSQKKVINAVKTSKINGQRVNERRYLKAQYEFEREKRLAEKTIYHKEKTHEWQLRLQNSPFLVDLAGDAERVEEEMYVREMEEKRRQRRADSKKRKIKNEIIIKALSEVPVLEQARKQKKQLLEQEKRERALRDIQRVEAVQERKARDLDTLQRDRNDHLENRAMQKGMPPISPGGASE
eukprot:TRINITY_DN2679_c0_g1_i1.p1 TRINITY_DN2679_c0_g1~~TRINITY_DN2679_c0_g1_i1.p1  ORF type:complete len:241 (+),score=116.53 TRINITY_DN2679_c0_g1_i1:61-783(+)